MRFATASSQRTVVNKPSARIDFLGGHRVLAEILEPKAFIEEYSGALTILVLCTLVLGTLLILVPQLLRAQQRTLEMQHLERMKALEQGNGPMTEDHRSRFAGRVAVLVPMVVVCAAATVTCFLVAYKSDNLFAVALSVWCVAAVVSLAAITGGVALMGRLAQLGTNAEDEIDDGFVDKSKGL
jgi:hypothetical protein